MNNGKLKLFWIRQDNNPVGNVLGYATHNAMMKKYCEPYFEYTEDAKIALTITPADFFVKIPNKINILFTMWECQNIPESYKKGLNEADLIVVPSRFCKEIFRPFTNKKIEVCWEGVEPDRFLFYQRRFPNFASSEKFRFLWIGAPNPRKGYYSILEISKIVEKVPEFELYIKTTAAKKSTFKEFLLINFRRLTKIIKNIKDKKITTNELSNMKHSIKRFIKPEISDKLRYFGKYKNIVFDTRKLDPENLISLYNSAHCFLSPHCGEGWNLPLCEAMATGCPSIATGASGCMDFFNEDVGYPIRYEIKETELLNYDCKVKIFIPNTQDLVEKMFMVFRDYKTALKKGRKASERIHNKFTWDRSAKRLYEIIQGALCDA